MNIVHLKTLWNILAGVVVGIILLFGVGLNVGFLKENPELESLFLALILIASTVAFVVEDLYRLKCADALHREIEEEHRANRRARQREIEKEISASFLAQGRMPTT